MTTSPHLLAIVNRRGRLAEQAQRGRHEMACSIRSALFSFPAEQREIPPAMADLPSTPFGAEISEAVRLWCQCELITGIIDRDEPATEETLLAAYARFREEAFPGILDSLNPSEEAKG